MAKHLLNLHGIGGVVSSRYAAGGAPQTAINQLVRYWKPQGIRSVVIIPISQADASFAQVGPN